MQGEGNYNPFQIFVRFDTNLQVRQMKMKKGFAFQHSNDPKHTTERLASPEEHQRTLKFCNSKARTQT